MLREENSPSVTSTIFCFCFVLYFFCFLLITLFSDAFFLLSEKFVPNCGVHLGTTDMSSGSVRRVSREDIQQVQNHIERCLKKYMNPKEAMETLLAQKQIEPGFTELVWQKLEEENQEFFKAYYLRLLLKEQITEFNRLLQEHAELSQLHPTAVASLPNGSHISALPRNPSCYAAEQARAALKPENMQHAVDSGLHNVFNNGGSSFHSSMHAVVEMSAHGNRIDSPPSMLSTQSSSMGLIQGINGGMIKSEPGYSGSSPYIFGPDGNVLEAHPTIGDASFTSFSMNGALLAPDISSFGVLGQISRTVSLSDLTIDFSQSSDIMESYPRCPYLVTANENFLERGEQGDDKIRRNDGCFTMKENENTDSPRQVREDEQHP